MRQRQIDALLILCSKVGLLQNCLAELPKLNKEWPITNNTPPTICRQSKSGIKRVTNVCAGGHYQDSCGSKTACEMSTAVPLMWKKSYSTGLGPPGRVYYSGLHAAVQFIKPPSHSLQHILHISLQNSFWREAAAAPSHRPWTLMLLFVG